MAEHILETRIQLRYGTYAQWMNSDIILKKGEAAVASFPRNRIIESLSNSQPDNTPPAIGIKIGDGVSYFSELPWVQAIAADVYNWAKSVNKPTYTADEIQGLVSFIEQNAPALPGDGTVAPRIYQIVQGTGANINRYYLRYKESSVSDEWIVDTTHYIDLESYAELLDWIGTDIENYGSLASRTEQHIQYDLGLINHVDTEQEGKFVTSVSQEGTHINVTKKTLTADDMSGIVPVEKGGTGHNEFESGEVLVGNGESPLRTLPIDNEVDTTNNLVRNYAVKAYVDQATAGLEGAMHLVGEATVEVQAANDPRIADYNFASAHAGDVVLWESKEYVWTGSRWRLLGDEGSYAIKGSIKDVDIDSEANIQQSKIYNLIETLQGKVDVEQGKGLSSNDYTNEDKIKLLGIEAGAQENIIEHILLNNVEAQPHTVNGADKTVELNVKEFDDESRLKLTSIEEGAQVNTIESISLNGVMQAPDNTKNVNLSINEFTAEDEAKLDGIEDEAQVNIIESVYLNNVEVSPDQNKRIDLVVHEITDAQAEKLESIEEGAQVNVIEHVKYDGNEISPDGTKTINIYSDPHTDHINVIESIAVNGTEISPDANKRVNLQLAQITPEQAQKLAGIEEGAQVNVIEHITYDGEEVSVDSNTKTARIISNRILGAVVPNGNTTSDIDINTDHKLVFAAIAKSGNVQHLLQTQDTYIIIDCGTSTEVID